MGDRIAPSAQYLVCFGDDPVNDLAGRRDIMDQPDSFAGDDGGDVKISSRLRRRIFLCNHIDVLQQFDLAPDPAARMIVDQAAAGKRRRPDIVARQVEDDAADTVAARRGADAPLGFLGPSHSWLA